MVCVSVWRAGVVRNKTGTTRERPRQEYEVNEGEKGGREPFITIFTASGYGGNTVLIQMEQLIPPSYPKQYLINFTCFSRFLA